MSDRINLSDSTHIDQVRRVALDRIERSEKMYKRAFYGAFMVEGLFLLGFVLLADLSDRLHVLILLATIAIYSIVGLGLFALGAHLNRCTERVLKAIELLGNGSDRHEK